jgi:hypothetical protein
LSERVRHLRSQVVWLSHVAIVPKNETSIAGNNSFVLSAAIPRFVVKSRLRGRPQRTKLAPRIVPAAPRRCSEVYLVVVQRSPAPDHLRPIGRSAPRPPANSQWLSTACFVSGCQRSKRGAVSDWLSAVGQPNNWRLAPSNQRLLHLFICIISWSAA